MPYQSSGRPRHAGASRSKIINYDAAENEPCRSNRASHRTADLRFPDARIIADRHLDNPESTQSALQDHFNGPAVGGLFEREFTQAPGEQGKAGEASTVAPLIRPIGAAESSELLAIQSADELDVKVTATAASEIDTIEKLATTDDSAMVRLAASFAMQKLGRDYTSRIVDQMNDESVVSQAEGYLVEIGPSVVPAIALSVSAPSGLRKLRSVQVAWTLAPCPVP